jgi:hypothetical protein
VRLLIKVPAYFLKLFACFFLLCALLLTVARGVLLHGKEEEL